MDEQDWLTEHFEADRTRLHAVAYRLLGSHAEADDAVQEAWLRLHRSDTDAVQNLSGWLTTVVSRVCLDMLRSRGARREEPLDLRASGTAEPDARYRASTSGPEDEALLGDSIGPALLVVLDALSPAERLAFVLHDLFAMPFDEIGPIVGRSPGAARQLASRARRRVQGAGVAPDLDRQRQREVVDAFLAASRQGDLRGLLAVLDPDVVFRADRVAVEAAASREVKGAPVVAPEVRGAAAVAGAFSGRARGAQLVLIDGVVGAAWIPGGQPRAVFNFSVRDGTIVEINLVADPEQLGQLHLVLLEQ